MRPITAAIAATLCVAASLISFAALSQGGFPDHPIRIVVPYNAGGAGDVMARSIGQAMGDALGQPVIVENRPGASGMIGTASVAREKGDPYTLLLASSAELSINPYLYKNVSYRADTDFEPIAFAGELPLVLVANPALPCNSLADVIALAKQKPDSIAFASAGAGQTAHLAMEIIMQKTGAKLLHVPYKGGAEAVMAVVGNQAQLFFSGLPPALPQIASGNLKALAVSTAERVAQLPRVPTVAEGGITGFDIYNWFALFAPAGVPQAIIERLNKIVGDAVDSDALKKVWNTQGIIAKRMQPQELSRFVATESSKYKALVEAAHITLD